VQLGATEARAGALQRRGCTECARFPSMNVENGWTFLFQTQGAISELSIVPPPKKGFLLAAREKRDIVRVLGNVMYGMIKGTPPGDGRAETVNITQQMAFQEQKMIQVNKES
jgi:hypothetical protein